MSLELMPKSFEQLSFWPRWATATLGSSAASSQTATSAPWSSTCRWSWSSYATPACWRLFGSEKLDIRSGWSTNTSPTGKCYFPLTPLSYYWLSYSIASKIGSSQWWHSITSRKCKKIYLRVAAIAPWFHLCLPSCGPRFKSQAHHLCFFQFVLLKLY